MGTLIEGDHGVARSAKAWNPAGKAQCITRPTVTEEDIRRAGRIAPDIGGYVLTENRQGVSPHVSRVDHGVGSASAAFWRWSDEPFSEVSAGRCGSHAAGEPKCSAQEAEL